MIPSDLRHFKSSEFKHPNLVNADAVRFLDRVRERCGLPIILTDDARTEDDHPSGEGVHSLHHLGQAFDIRIRQWSKEDLWLFIAAVIAEAALLPSAQRGVELELVWSAKDKHAHIGCYLNGRRDRFVPATD